MTPFLIGSIPEDAEYADNNTFIEMTKEHFDLNWQIEDPAWSDAELQRINNTPPDRKWADYFEIKDVQMSPVDCEILCSICIFKRDVEVGHGTFPFYVKVLKEKIEQFAQSDHANQKLRVYVGNSAWDTLHTEKILQNKDVDFVRMRSSSSHSILGMQWRILAYDDYDYSYVYLNDTHHVPKGEYNDVEFKEKVLTDSLLDTFHFALVTDPPMRDPHLELYNIAYYNKPPGFRSHYFYVMELNNYLNFNDLKIVRGPMRLPFSDVVRIIAASYERRLNPYTVYDPRYSVWTELGQLPFFLEWTNGLGYWIFFLRRHIKIWYRYIEDYHRLLNELNANHFLKRLHNQEIENG